MSQSLIAQIAQELAVATRQVSAAVELLDGGATVPFIARYRKEATGGLDDAQLRALQERLIYLRELSARRDVVLASIDQQGKLTPALAQALASAATKQALEDLYLPFKPKRRSKAQVAIEAGLLPLAEAVWADPCADAQSLALNYVSAQVLEDQTAFASVAAVLDGVRDILSERWAQDAQVVQFLREWWWDCGLLQSRVASGKASNDVVAAKFTDYFEYDEAIARVPSHRALAVFRGRDQEILDVKLTLPQEPQAGAPSLAEGHLARLLGWSHQGRSSDDLLRKCVAWTWRVKLSLSLERDLLARLRQAAEATAIKVFGDNLRDLLLAAAAGAKTVMGLDPGIRTGVKVAVVDATGKLVDTATVYPHEPRRDWDGALHTLEHLCRKHAVALVAIGNGTASRETDQLAAEVIERLRSAAPQHRIQRLVVSEAGASVYSASAYASQEMPQVDVTLRGAASIARRVQDPLAELVKIDPKSIGVGQYQHDVNQHDLARQLDAVVEDCVNGVGVDLNTASVPLLSRVSGLSWTVAASVVRWREVNGVFRNRAQLREVSGLGAKTFEQCAGFLRIRGGDNPLDMTGVHPETYPLVQAILAQLRRPIDQVMGKSEVLKGLNRSALIAVGVGEMTLADIVGELEKPGRDPRPDFVVARFNDGVNSIGDLTPGMVLQGTVSNVAAFGAFVDIGVHQDGLVHVSQLSHRFVKDAREVVKTGQIVQVRVIEVDAPRQRISLSLRMDAAPDLQACTKPSSGASRTDRAHRGVGERPGVRTSTPQSAMAAAFARVEGARK